MSIFVEVKDFEALGQVKLLVFSSERFHPLNEVTDSDLLSVKALRHPQVKQFAEIGVVYAYHVLDVLREILFC